MRDEPGTFDEDVVEWAADRLGLSDAIHRRIVAALRQSASVASPRPDVWGLEYHLDAPGRVDLSLLVERGEPHVLDDADLSVTAGRHDIWEYDLDSEAGTLAGVFHEVVDARLPPWLPDLGTPLLISRMTGRDGSARIVFPVPDQAALDRMIAALVRSAVPPETVDLLDNASPLVTDGRTLRVVIEFHPDRQRIGSRLGIEVILDPSVFDVAAVLPGLGVAPDSVARMTDLVSRLPVSRTRGRHIPGLPMLDARVDAIGITHLSIAWLEGSVRLKCYLMVTSGPASTRRQVLEAASARMSTAWPDRLRWAGRQLPLAGAAPDLDAWRDVVDPGATGQFERRLELGGLTIDQARVALSPHDAIRPADHDWMPFLRLFLDTLAGDTAVAATDDPLRWLADREQHLPPAARTIPFAHLLWPVATAAWDDIAEDPHPIPGRLTAGAVDDLRIALLTRLADVLAPTLTEELASGLTFGQRLLARMGDEPIDPPRAGYAQTCLRLAGGDIQRVLLDVPVLPSLIGTAMRQWHEATLELLQRTDACRAELHAVFDIPPDAAITGVHGSAGDRHNDGRAVAVISFGDARVVYKPRDCRLEALWESVTSHVNRHLPDPGVRAARILTRTDGSGAHYGFAEYIAQEPCTSDDQLASFYANAGRTLALLYSLSATDGHFENLVAHRDQLVLVDAEALFETRSTRMQVVEPGSDPGVTTVMQVGLLPTWLWLEGERVAIDISALGCVPNGTARATSRGWRAINTDAMSRGRTNVIAPHPVSLPTPAGVAPNLPAHVDDVVVGFTEGYDAIVAARDAGLLAMLADARSLSRRLIQRPTYVYAALLGQAREPGALLSPASLGMVLEKLTRAYLVDGADEVWPLLEAEQRAMSRMDVPLFEAALDGHVTTSRDVRIEGWPGVDALEVVLSRIARLDGEDRARQVRLIRASFAAHDFQPSVATRGEPTPRASAAVSRGAMADRCREHVTAHAMRVGDAVTWMTLTMLPDGAKANVQLIGSGLYDGALGVSLFLHAAGEHDMARLASASLLDQLDPEDPARARALLLAVGPGMSGAGGYLRALRLLARHGHVSADAADRAISAILRATSDRSLSSDNRLDLLSGVAGLISPLAREASNPRLEAADRDRARRLAQAGAERLRLTQTADGGWSTLPGSGPLTGLAHGASGIALALTDAAVMLDDDRYLTATLRGLAFEQALFDEDAENWRDLRSTAHGDFMMGWCAGAPGIALARMRLIEILGDHPQAELWRAELETAATTTVTAPDLARDHLCCGNLGRAAILRILGERRRRPDWSEASAAIIERALSRAGDGLPHSFLGADSDLLAIPGLMTGQSGAGLLLLDAPTDWLAAVLL